MASSGVRGEQRGGPPQASDHTLLWEVGCEGREAGQPATVSSVQSSSSHPPRWSGKAGKLLAWPGPRRGALRQIRGYSPLLSREGGGRSLKGQQSPSALECPGMGRLRGPSLPTDHGLEPHPPCPPPCFPLLCPPLWFRLVISQLLIVPLSLLPHLQGPGDPCLPAPRRPGPQLQAQRWLGLGQLVEPVHVVLSVHRAPVHLQNLIALLQPRPGSRAPWSHLEAGERQRREPSQGLGGSGGGSRRREGP